jgi:hypothetical protein
MKIKKDGGMKRERERESPDRRTNANGVGPKVLETRIGAARSARPVITNLVAWKLRDAHTHVRAPAHKKLRGVYEARGAGLFRKVVRVVL